MQIEVKRTFGQPGEKIDDLRIALKPHLGGKLYPQADSVTSQGGHNLGESGRRGGESVAGIWPRSQTRTRALSCEASFMAARVASTRRSRSVASAYPRRVGNVSDPTRKFRSSSIFRNCRRPVSESSAGRTSFRASNCTPSQPIAAAVCNAFLKGCANARVCAAIRKDVTIRIPSRRSPATPTYATCRRQDCLCSTLLFIYCWV